MSSDNREDSVRAIAQRLPKAQLHLHLDGSLPESFIAARAAIRSFPLPSPPAHLRAHFLAQKASLQAADAYTQPRNGNWPAFAFCNHFLQTTPELADATAAVTRLLLDHNTRVIELRFCPALHTLEGLSEHQAIEAVVTSFEAVRRAVAPALRPRGGIILCALRSHSAAHVQRTADLAAAWLGRGVVGLDLAGDEAAFPLHVHADTLRDAAAARVPLTVHAGEAGQRAEENVRLAVELGARRLGHVLALGGRRELCEVVRRHGVAVELCLTANCSGGGKVGADAFAEHPVGEMLAEDVMVAGFNCDNLLLSGTIQNRPDPTEEIVRAKMGCGLSWKEIRAVLVNGACASFDAMGSEQEVTEFVKRFKADIDAVLAPTMGVE